MRRALSRISQGAVVLRHLCVLLAALSLYPIFKSRTCQRLNFLRTSSVFRLNSFTTAKPHVEKKIHCYLNKHSETSAT